jgi:hypothetical protein
MLPLRQGFSEFSAWENVRYGSTTERTDEPPASAAAEVRCHLGARADCTADGGCALLTLPLKPAVTRVRGLIARQTAAALHRLPLKPAVTWVRGRLHGRRRLHCIGCR